MKGYEKNLQENTGKYKKLKWRNERKQKDTKGHESKVKEHERKMKEK